MYYKLGQASFTNWGSFVLLQIRTKVVTNWGISDVPLMNRKRLIPFK